MQEEICIRVDCLPAKLGEWGLVRSGECCDMAIGTTYFLKETLALKGGRILEITSSAYPQEGNILCEIL